MTAIRSFYRDSSILALGEGLAALAAIGSLALAARILGPDEFGRLAMIVSLAAVLDLVFNLQSGRLMVRYGADPVAGGRRDELAGLLKLCVLLDLAGGLTAWLSGAILVSVLVPGTLDLPSAALQVYLVTVLTNVCGHANGLLRLLGQFVGLAVHRVVSALFRLAGMIMLVASGSDGLAQVVWTLVIAELAGRVVLVALSLLAARKAGVAGFLLVPLPRIRDRYPDIVSFAGLANLGDAVLKVAQQLDIFVVAALMAPAEAGLFRAVKSLGSVPQLAASAVSQVLYPAIAHRDIMGGRELWAFLRPVWLGLAGASLAGCLVYFLVSDYLVPLIFGADYSEAVTPSAIYVAGASLGLAMVPVTPLVLVRGQQRRLFVSYLGAAAAYVGGVSIGASAAGLAGAAAGLAALYVVYAIISALFWVSGRK